MPGKTSGLAFELELQAKYSRLTREQVKDLKERFKNEVIGTLPRFPEGDLVKQRAAVKQRPTVKQAPTPRRKPAPKGPGKTQKKQ
jgi:hypothetical protein